MSVEKLPLRSVTVCVTVVSPRGKSDGASSVPVGVGSSMSNTSCKPRATPAAPPVVLPSTVMSAGAVIVGSVVSSTVIVKLPLSELVESSVAVQLTVVTPRGKNPELRSQVTAGEASTMSVADAAGNVTLAPPSVFASTVKLVGVARVGSVVSSTVTILIGDVLDYAAC